MSAEGNPKNNSKSSLNEVENTSERKIPLQENSEKEDSSQGKEKHLTEEQRGSIRIFSSEWLHNFNNSILEGSDIAASFRGPFGDDVLTWGIAELSGDVDMYKKRLISSRHAEGVEVFFDELIRFCNTLRKDKNQFRNFLSNIHSVLFSYSPNIFNEMKIGNQFLTVAKANRVPEIQGWFGQSIVGELVYELSFAPDKVMDSIYNKVENLQTTEKIEALKQCQIVAAIAVSNGDLARKTFLWTKKVAEKLKSDPNVLVSLIASETVERLENEYKHPSMVITTYGDESRGRSKLSREATEEMREKNEKVEGFFAIQKKDIQGSFSVPIASDAIGVYDHAFDLQGVGFVEGVSLDNLESIRSNEIGPPEEKMEKIISFLEQVTDPHVDELRSIISFIEKYYAEEDPTTVLNSMFPKYSVDEWRVILEEHHTLYSINQAVQEMRSKMLSEAENRNLQLTKEYIDEVLRAIENRDAQDEREKAFLDGHYQEIQEALQKDDFEHAFQEAIGVTLFFNRNNYTSLGVKESSGKAKTHYLVALQKELTANHGKVFAHAQKEFQVFQDTTRADFEKIEKSLEKKLEAPEFYESLKKFIFHKKNQMKSERLRVEIESLQDNLHFENEWQYMNKYSEEEKELFLKALFDPLLRERIAADLGINWTEISLSSQIHFLEYLVRIDRERYVKLAEILKRYKGSREILFEVFLAAQYGEDYGDTILKIAESESEKKQKILEAYSSLNKTAKEMGAILGGDFFIGELKVSSEVKTMLPRQVAEAIMRRSKDILNVAAEIIEKGEVSAPFYDADPIAVTSIDEVLQSLEIYTKALDSIKALLKESSTTFGIVSREKTNNMSTYHLKMKGEKSESFMSLQLRKYGARPGEHDVEREFDGEARINFLFSDTPIGTNLRDEARRNALSLRIDREGKTRENGKIVHNDPSRKDGELSLEIGSVFHEDQTLPSAVVGRVVSVGNYLGLLRQQRLETENPEYYHNRESFAKELGDADVFAHIVENIEKAMESRFSGQE